MLPENVLKQAEAVLKQARAYRRMIAVAESCTGGLIAAALTSVPGSSEVFERGFVTYSNQSKLDNLGIPLDIIKQHGAVSEECAQHCYVRLPFLPDAA